MPTDQNPQPRRPHFYRGRRGADRRGPERRASQQPAQSGGREAVDVEQIMREIRAHIAERRGIELTPQQIQELAARRLEAILDPRTLKPELLEQLRRSAGTPIEVPEPAAAPSYVFEDTTLYDSHRALVRVIRRLLNPILKLFLNPNPLIRALNIQARLNGELLARQAERERRQAEWNALQYELLQRLVTEVARASLEVQSLAGRVESIAAKLDFNERRVRTLENIVHQGRIPARAAEAVVPAAAGEAAAAAPQEGAAEGGRRKRRRRRGRRGVAAVGAFEAAATAEESAAAPGSEGPALAAGEEGEPQQAAAPAPEPIAGREEHAIELASIEPAPAVPPAPQPSATTAPAPFPLDHPAPATSPITPPQDEPNPEAPVDRPEPGPPER